MPEKIRALCENLARSFCDGDLDGACRHYRHPLAVYAPDGIFMETSQEETKRALLRLRNAARAFSMASVRVEIDDFEISCEERTPVSLRWHFERSDGTRIGTSQLIYFLARDKAGIYRIELLEIRFSPFPPIVAGQSGRRIIH